MSGTLKRKPRGFFATEEGQKILEKRRQAKIYTYEKLAELAEVNGDQVKRLANPGWGYRVQRDAIVKIAKVLDLEPTDIVDTDEWLYCPPRKTLKAGKEDRYKSRIVITLELEEFSDTLQAELSELLQKHSSDPTMKIEKAEKGSVVLFVESSPEGFERIQTLFREGRLGNLLGVPVEDVWFVSAESTRTAEEQEELAKHLLRRCRRQGYSWVELSQILDIVQEAYLATQQTIETAFTELLLTEASVVATKQDKNDEDSNANSENLDLDLDFIDALTEEVTNFYEQVEY